MKAKADVPNAELKVWCAQCCIRIARNEERAMAKPITRCYSKLHPVLPVHGSKTQWYRNLLKNPTITIKVGNEQRMLKAKTLRGAAAVRRVIHSFGSKYTPEMITKRYPGPLDVAVKVKL